MLGTLAHNQPLSENDIEAERMKLIVGMSRGKKKLIVFTPFARDGSHLNFANTRDLQGTQYPLNHFITDNHQVVEITSNEDIKEKFELLLPRNDQLASFIALEELMQANAYGSDQIAATRKRVVAIMEHDLQPRNPSDSATESLFAHYVEHELKFVPRDSQKIPIEVEVFLLLDADDRLNSLLGRYDFKPTDGPVADLLLRYNNYYLQPKNTGNRIQMIQSRHELYTAYDQYITKLEKKGVQRKYDVENVEKIIYRFEQNIVDGLHEIQKNMKFHEYPWTENIKNNPKLALLTYVSSDHEKIVKQLEGIKWPLSKEQFADIEELLYEISTAPNNTFQKFKQLCDDLKGWPTYKLSLESFTDCLEGLLIWLYNTQKDVTKALRGK